MLSLALLIIINFWHSSAMPSGYHLGTKDLALTFDTLDHTNNQLNLETPLVQERTLHIPVRADNPANDESADPNLAYVTEEMNGDDEAALMEDGARSRPEKGMPTLTRHKRASGQGKGSRRPYRRKARRYPDLSGDIVFSARRAFRLFFDFDYKTLSDSDIMSAQVLLYHTRPKRLLHSRKARSVTSSTPRDDIIRGQRSKVTKSARVIMHQTIEYGADFGSTRATDIKLVDARARGWMSFDITQALKDWISDPEANQGLELWIVSSTPGRYAARVASRMRFVKPSSKRMAYRPELVVKLKTAKASRDENKTT